MGTKSTGARGFNRPDGSPCSRNEENEQPFNICTHSTNYYFKYICPAVVKGHDRTRTMFDVEICVSAVEQDRTGFLPLSPPIQTFRRGERIGGAGGLDSPPI